MGAKTFKFEKPLLWASLNQLLWLGFAIGTGASFFYFVFYISLFFVLLSALIHKMNTLRLISQFEIEKTELTAGESIAIRYRVLNNSIIPAFNVKIYPVISKSFGYEQFDSDQHGFDSYEVKVIDRKLICQRRGFYNLGEVAFEVKDPLGNMTTYFSKSKNIEVVVRPRIYNIEGELMSPLERSGIRGMSLRHLSDRTSIKSVRPYVEGDALRDIHWKLTAKTGELKTKEFTQSVSEKIYLLIDGCRNSYLASPERADDAMDLAASLCHSWLKRGIPVQVIFSDEGKTTFSGRNLSAEGRFLDQFTAFNPNGWLAFEDFLERELKGHRDGGRWVSISTGTTQKIDQMLLTKRNQQFSWRHYIVTSEGRQLL